MQRLDILYFAWVAERLGCDSEQIAHPGAATRICDLVAQLAHGHGDNGAIFADIDRLRFALDQHMAHRDDPLGDARELAIFPPVTGG
jgi:molybdopterin synthase sulfur carrier subunit